MEVDVKHDVRCMGTYTPDGQIYIDRVAWKNMTLAEQNAIVRHEKKELQFRLAGTPYKTAHRRAMREERGYTPSLENKLRAELNKFGDRQRINPPPKNAMGGFLPSVEFERSYRSTFKSDLSGRRPQDRLNLPSGYSLHVLTKGKECTNRKGCGLHYFYRDTVWRDPTGIFYCPTCGAKLK